MIPPTILAAARRSQAADRELWLRLRARLPGVRDEDPARRRTLLADLARPAAEELRRALEALSPGALLDVVALVFGQDGRSFDELRSAAAGWSRERRIAALLQVPDLADALEAGMRRAGVPIPSLDDNNLSGGAAA